MIRIAATVLLLLPFATTSYVANAKSDAPKGKSDYGRQLLFQLEAKVAADVAKDGQAGFFTHWAGDYVELAGC
jgi:hypothetical protein